MNHLLLPHRFSFVSKTLALCTVCLYVSQFLFVTYDLESYCLVMLFLHSFVNKSEIIECIPVCIFFYPPFLAELTVGYFFGLSALKCIIDSAVHDVLCV